MTSRRDHIEKNYYYNNIMKTLTVSIGINLYNTHSSSLHPSVLHKYFPLAINFKLLDRY